MGKAPVIGSARGHPAAAASPLSPRFGLLVLTASGILSLLLEMLVLSYFQQFTAASLYAMTAVLFAFIVNLGIGSLLAAWLRARGRRTEPLLCGVLVAGGVQLFGYPFLLQRLLQARLLQPQVSLSAWTVQAMLLATLAFAPLLIILGMVFPLGWELIERGNRHHGEALGHAVALNKVGSALGAFLAPFVLVPLLGLPGAMMCAGWGYLALAAWGAFRLSLGAPPARLVYAGAWRVLVIAVLTFIHRRPPLVLNPQEHLLALYQGADGVTAVTEDAEHSRHIVLNQSLHVEWHAARAALPAAGELAAAAALRTAGSCGVHRRRLRHLRCRRARFPGARPHRGGIGAGSRAGGARTVSPVERRALHRPARASADQRWTLRACRMPRQNMTW